MITLAVAAILECFHRFSVPRLSLHPPFGALTCLNERNYEVGRVTAAPLVSLLLIGQLPFRSIPNFREE